MTEASPAAPPDPDARPEPDAIPPPEAAPEPEATSTPEPPPSPEPTPERDAAREFAAVWGEHARAARVYRAAVLALSLALVAAVWGLVGVSRFVPQPLFVRVDDVGRPRVVEPEQLYFDRDPTDKVVRHFLVAFVRLHVSRIRARVRDDFTHSLYFLSRDAGQAAYADALDEIAAVAAGTAPEREVADIVLHIYPRPEAPHRAEATFEMLEAGPSGARRSHWTAVMEFDWVEAANTEFALVNPIGLVVTDLRLTEASAE